MLPFTRHPKFCGCTKFCVVLIWISQAPDIKQMATRDGELRVLGHHLQQVQFLSGQPDWDHREMSKWCGYSPGKADTDTQHTHKT